MAGAVKNDLMEGGRELKDDIVEQGKLEKSLTG